MEWGLASKRHFNPLTPAECRWQEEAGSMDGVQHLPIFLKFCLPGPCLNFLFFVLRPLLQILASHPASCLALDGSCHVSELGQIVKGIISSEMRQSCDLKSTYHWSILEPEQPLVCFLFSLRDIHAQQSPCREVYPDTPIWTESVPSFSYLALLPVASLPPGCLNLVFTCLLCVCVSLRL